MKTTANSWDWLSIRDRFDTLSDALEVPPNSHSELANELRDMADWIDLVDPSEALNTYEYEGRIRELETEGMTRSDAQAVADAEILQGRDNEAV